MQNARSYGHEDVLFVVAGDRKTPAETGTFCAALQDRFGYPTVFMDTAAQEAYLADYPELASHLVYDSIQRRNVALLYAYERAADVVVTIDDDNFPTGEDFVGAHAIAGSTVEIDVVASPTGWVNVCGFLEEENGREFYPRGHAFGARWLPSDASVTRSRVKVAVNGGLWLEDPDLDAITRLYQPIRALAYSRDASFALAVGSWAPFNSQNTALAAEVVPAYFLSPYAGRYDDIWASYVVKAIADHLRHLIAFGHPLVRQERNPHDYWADLAQERLGMLLTDRLCAWLRALPLTGDGYGACYAEILRGLESRISQARDLAPDARSCLERFLQGMEVWLATMERCSARRRSPDPP